MGFLLGSSTIFQSPFCKSLPPSFLTSSERKHGKKKMVIMASMKPENPNDANFITRRTFPLVDLSALPFLHSRASAVEGLMKGKPNTAKKEQVRQQRAPSNAFVGFLNGVGVIGVGVLGALYALAQRARAELNSTIDSMKSELSEKEKAMAIMENNYKKTLQSEQEERSEEIKKVKEEVASLLNQLAFANNELKKLQLELQCEKKLEQDLKAHIDHLENLSLSLDEKELECKKLTSIYNQTKDNLSHANSAVEGLTEDVRKIREELELKKSLEEDLNTKIKLLVAERDEINKKVHVLHEEYNDFRSASAKREASDAKLLSNKESELGQLKQKLKIVLNEASNTQSLIAGLTRERNSLRTMLEMEANAVKNLRGELQITQDTLGASRLVAADFLKQLNQSERSREDLTSEISRIQAEFAEAQKSLNHNLDEMKSELCEKEAAMAIMENYYKKRLQSEQEERSEEIRKVKEEVASLLNQLASANNELKKLQLELQSEKKLEQDLKAHIDHLQSVIAQAGEDKQTLKAELQLKQDEVEFLQERISLLCSEIKEKEISIENLSLSLDEKELECKKLTSIYNQTKDNLSQANSAVEGLTEDVRKIREELELKKSLEEDLNSKIKLLVAERDEINKKAHVLHEEYNDFKSASAKREAFDAKILANKESELSQLKQKLKIILNEASNNQSLIVGLTRERDSLRNMLEKEANAVKNLRGELQITQDTLGASRLEAADLLKQLNQSERLREDLTSEILRIQAEFAEAKKSLNDNLDEVKLSLKQRSDNLASIEKDLKKTKQHLLAMTNELKDVAEDRENLKKELLEVSKKAETTARDLKEEREVVAALNMELKEMRKHVSKDKDARGELEKDLEETKKSLDEINRKALLLSRELELANSNNASLEKERDMLSKSLAEEKHTAQDIQVNLATSHKLLTELHEETENLEKKDQMLQVELASAKGETLRLRRELKKIYEEQQQTSRGGRGRGRSSRGPTSGTSQ